MSALVWQRNAPGWYVAQAIDTSDKLAATGHEITRVQLDDGAWWIIRYPDGQTGDPFATLADAKRALS